MLLDSSFWPTACFPITVFLYPEFLNLLSFVNDSGIRDISVGIDLSTKTIFFDAPWREKDTQNYSLTKKQISYVGPWPIFHVFSYVGRFCSIWFLSRWHLMRMPDVICHVSLTMLPATSALSSVTCFTYQRHHNHTDLNLSCVTCHLSMPPVWKKSLSFDTANLYIQNEHYIIILLSVCKQCKLY